MENVKHSWDIVFCEDRLDPCVDDEEIHHLTNLGLDFPFHIVEVG